MAGTITTIVKALFRSEGADKVASDIKKVGQAGEEVSKKQTRLGNESTNTGRAFASQASGLGGLVAAYAGAAATLFALQQGFSALKAASQSEQLFFGINQLAANIGESGPKILASITEITKGQIAAASAAEKANLALSSGFGGEQINQLASIATKASRVLGRDLEDSLTRLIRGTTKLEPELLDELGIFTRIEPAVQAYAAQIGKSETSLTNFERRQAFLNAVIEEGNRKFKSVNVTVPTAAESLNQLSARLQDLTTKFGLFLATAATPLVNFFSQNITGAFGLFALLSRTVISKGLDVMREKFDKAAASAKSFGESISFQARSNTKSKVAIEELAAASEAFKKGSMIGLKGDERTRARELKDLATAGKLTVEQSKEYVSLLQKSRDYLENQRTSQKAIVDAAKSIKPNDPRLITLAGTETKVKQANSELEALNKTLAVTPLRAGIAEASFSGISKVIQGFGTLLSGTVKSINFVLFAVGTLSTVAGVIASIYGKEAELSTFTENLGKFFKELITGSESAKEFRTGLAGGVNFFFKEIEKTDQKLKETDKFQFKTKFLGVTINVTKTKEDLAKEVQDLVRQSIEGKTFLDKVGENAGASIASGIGGGILGAIGINLLARVVPAVIGTFIGGPAGTAAGIALGSALATSLMIYFKDTGNEQIEATLADAARNALGRAAEAADVDKLARVFKKIEEARKAAPPGQQQSELYAEAQKKLAVELIKNQNLFAVLGNVAFVTGISIDSLFNNFNKSIVEANKSINELITSIKGFGEIKISFINPTKLQQEITEVIDKLKGSSQSIGEKLETNPIELTEANRELAASERRLANLREDAAKLETRAKEVLTRDRGRRRLSAPTPEELSTVGREARRDTDTKITQELERRLGIIQTIQRLEQDRGSYNTQIDLITEANDLLKNREDLFKSSLSLQNNITGALSVQNDFEEELASGLLTREQISQRLFTVNKLLARSEADIAKTAELTAYTSKLRDLAGTLIMQGLGEEAKALLNIANILDSNLETNKRATAEALKLRDAQKEQAKLQDAILQTSELLRKTFQQELGSVDKLNFLFDKNYRLAKNNEQVDSNRLQFLEDSIELSKSALETEQKLASIKVRIGGEEKALRDVAIEDLGRVEGANEAQTNLRRSFTGATVQLAKLGRDTNNVLAGLFQKTIIEAQTVARELAKQAKELQAKTTEAVLQNELQALKDRLSAEQQRISIYEKERGLLNELADANAKARDIDIERQKIAQTRGLLLAKEMSSNDVLGNFFTDQQKQQIEIKIAEADLRALEDTTRNQIDAIKRKAESDEMAIKEQIKSNEAQTKIRLNIIDKERALNVARLEGQKEAAIADLEIQKLKINALIKESEILQNHVAGIAKVLLDDRIERELAMEGGAGRLAERQNIRGAGDPGEVGPLITDPARIREILKTRIESEVRQTISETGASLRVSLNTIEDLTKATKGLYGTQIAGVNSAAAASRTREQEQAAADKRELERKLLINAQVAQNDIQTLQNRLAEARNNYERLTEIARLSNNVGIQIASDFVKNIRDNVGKALQDLGQAILEGTLTLKNFAQGAKDVFIKILRDLGTSIFQRLVVAPIQNFLVESLSKPIMEFFGINTNAPIQDNTAALQALTAAIQGRAGVTPGATPGASSTYGGDTLERQNTLNMKGVSEQQQKASEASEGFGDKLKTLGVNFQTVGAVAIGTFGAVLAATGNWKKAFLATILTTFSTMLTQIVMKSSLAGVGSAFSAAGSGISGFFGNLFGSGASAASSTAIPSAMANAGVPIAIGGQVRHMAAGGYAGLRDRVPALLEPGEFVIRRPAAMAIGGDTLNQMNATGQTGPGNVTVNMSNQGTPQEVIGTPKVSMNGRDMIVDIVVKDIQNNGPIRKTLRGGM